MVKNLVTGTDALVGILYITHWGCSIERRFDELVIEIVETLPHYYFSFLNPLTPYPYAPYAFRKLPDAMNHSKFPISICIIQSQGIMRRCDRNRNKRRRVSGKLN
jgi:hypothetical protein